MTNVNTGGPAFPTVAGQVVYSNGMSLRDWFAGQWLAAGHHANLSAKDAADQAYEIADAMLKARAGRADSGDTDYNDGCWRRPCFRGLSRLC